jgi:D-serine dehydratase
MGAGEGSGDWAAAGPDATTANNSGIPIRRARLACMPRTLQQTSIPTLADRCEPLPDPSPYSQRAMQPPLDQSTLLQGGGWRTPIDWHAKGFPALTVPIAAGEVALQGWNLFDGRFLLPTMVVRETALEHNIRLIADYCAATGVSLAPHGKTTMSPDIFWRQLEAGAWAMTLATPWQARVAATVGVPRIILANEITDPAGIDWLASTLDGDRPEVTCWVDSVAGVELLDDRIRQHARPLPVCIEVGLVDGRAGVRTLPEALAVARRVSASRSVRLAGVSFFEGVAQGSAPEDREHAVRALIQLAREVAIAIEDQIAAGGATELILTGGGSQYLDLVAQGLSAPLGTTLPTRVVLRSGCTVSHDDGGYDLVSPFGSIRAGDGPRLRPALEVWAPVLSVPEPGRAIAGAGKRDLPHDGAMPMVLAVRDRFGTTRRLPDDGGIIVARLNDQHAYLDIDAAHAPAVGDLVAFGVRHPCMAFDRWRWIPVVNDAYDVIDAYELLF